MRRVAKMKLKELLPLKVYPFTLKQGIKILNIGTYMSEQTV